jgi:Flp pilus assembly protein TadG
MMPALKNSFSSFRRNERGNTAILFAMAMIPVTALTGGSVDYGRVLAEKARLQAASDAAVVAGSSLVGATDEERVAAARNVFNANFGGGSLVPQIRATPSTVEISAAVNVKTPFLNLINIPTMEASVYSIAAGTDLIRTEQTAKVCLLALDPQSDDGIHIQGANRVLYENCWAHTNSVKPTAINGVSSTSSAVGAGHCAVGGWVDGHGAYSPAPKAGCLEVADPFATTSAYATAGIYDTKFAAPVREEGCKANKLNLKKGTFNLEPGRYCGGIEIQAGATVNFAPGTYYIDDGLLGIQAGATATGSNLLFYLAGESSAFAIRGGGKVELSGRTTGSSHAGFLLMMHPDANRMGTSNIQGGGVFGLEGLIYAPTQRIEVSGNGDANTGGVDVFGMVAKDFYFRGNGVFKLTKYTGGDVPDIMPSLPILSSRVSVIQREE